MHIHILGIGGTFMGGLAALARELNFKVTGSDLNIYPPMSTQLEALGIQCYQGYSEDVLALKPDCFVVGNVMTRGMPVVEALLNQNLPFMSGPEWLAKYVLTNNLANRHVLAVSGTHGKTTTSSMLAWILEEASLSTGHSPGFLIGGIPSNFEVSARLGNGPCFVVEADEYDSAFFDKRSKFIHYRPRTLIINNIEFDHADIFSDLTAIQTQFHHLIRTVASQGLIVHPHDDPIVQAVLERGCWTPRTTIGFSNKASLYAKNSNVSGNHFEVWFENTQMGTIEWPLIGQHNVANALAAIAAAYSAGISPEKAIKALCHFKGVKRRLEVKGTVNEITVYDDFAHHPTAIKSTLEGLRAAVGRNSKIFALIDLRSNTMRAGHHQHTLSDSFVSANYLYLFKPSDIQWDVEKMWRDTEKPGGVYTDIQKMLEDLKNSVGFGDHVIFMSNGGFSNSQTEFLNKLSFR